MWAGLGGGEGERERVHVQSGSYSLLYLKQLFVGWLAGWLSNDCHDVVSTDLP